MDKTPETDKLLGDLLAELGTLGRHNCPEKLVVHARRLEIERDEARERERVAIVSWEKERQRALREGQRVVEAMAQNAKLRDIAERAINAMPPDGYGGMRPSGTLRAELEQLKEASK